MLVEELTWELLPVRKLQSLKQLQVRALARRAASHTRGLIKQNKAGNSGPATQSMALLVGLLLLRGGGRAALTPH